MEIIFLLIMMWVVWRCYVRSLPKGDIVINVRLVSERDAGPIIDVTPTRRTGR